MVHVPQHVAGGSRLLSRADGLALAGFRLAHRLAPWAPRGVGYRLADLTGELSFLANAPGRRAVRANLTRILGRPPSPRLVRLVFRHGARNYYDTLILPRISASDLLALIQVDTWEHLNTAMAAGRGVIMVGVHLSSVAFAGQVVAAKGYPTTSVVERIEPPALHDLLARLRSAGGIRILTLSTDVTRELLAALRRNEVVGLVMDRDVAGTGVEVEFFGARVRMPGGAALLALRTGAPILPGIAVRTPDQRFRGWIGPPISIERGADLREGVRLTTQRIAQTFERYIRSYPEQWTVYQPFWSESDNPRGTGGCQ